MQGAEGPEALAGAREGLPERDGHLHSHAAEALVRVRFRLHNSYLNFVECLRYFDEALVTDELMQYAVSLIDGFDDIIDDPSVGDEMKPTPGEHSRDVHRREDAGSRQVRHGVPGYRARLSREGGAEAYQQSEHDSAGCEECDGRFPAVL